MTDFKAELGHSLDMGSFPFAAVQGDLSGTHALLRVGAVGDLRALITSPSPPVGCVVDWDPDAGLFRVDLTSAVIDAIGVGRWVYKISIVRSSGTRLLGCSGGFQVVRGLPLEMAA